jgi:hypothetical protein
MPELPPLPADPADFPAFVRGFAETGDADRGFRIATVIQVRILRAIREADGLGLFLDNLLTDVTEAKLDCLDALRG